MTYLRAYLLLLGVATIALTVATLLPLIDAPPTPGTPPPHLRSSLPHLDEVPQRVRVLGYSREEFGNGWSTSSYRGCDTRELMILAAVHGTHAGCEATGTTTDPYTGEPLNPSVDPVEIDHILPLSGAWDLGAHHWDHARRRDFANDPVNLVVTSQAANQEKSDDLPTDWLPEHPATRCWYARRLAEVAVSYQLPLPTADIGVMKRQCLLREFPPR
ncbi:HNH endonuclease family protein [Corynebacterium halotolerans]|uniref:HNH endonuclease family protein n=1 Tax=Corynebacterium halotolerans TaxID=225326 RepID=UPI003CF6EA12